MPELITTVVIENRLEFLAAHPDHLNWMLSPFARHRDLAKIVDAKYISECIKYIQNCKTLIRPVNEADLSKLPSIVIASNQGESEQFIGDYGSELQTQESEPDTIIVFDVTEIDRQVIKTPTIDVAKAVWPTLWAKSGDFESRIDMVVEKEGETWLYLKDEPPAGTPLRAWKATTSNKVHGYQLGASIDSVKVQVMLTTAGDHAIHRLMCTLLRYALKSGRALFDCHGMQVATFSQQPVTLIDPDQLIWQTTFSVDAKMTDFWITDEFTLDDSGPLNIEIIPSRATIERG
jgi:hypothetical protein